MTLALSRFPAELACRGIVGKYVVGVWQTAATETSTATPITPRKIAISQSLSTQGSISQTNAPEPQPPLKAALDTKHGFDSSLLHVTLPPDTYCFNRGEPRANVRGARTGFSQQETTNNVGNVPIPALSTYRHVDEKSPNDPYYGHCM